MWGGPLVQLQTPYGAERVTDVARQVGLASPATCQLELHLHLLLLPIAMLSLVVGAGNETRDGAIAASRQCHRSSGRRMLNAPDTGRLDHQWLRNHSRSS